MALVRKNIHTIFVVVQEWRSGSPAWRQNLRETRTVAPQQHNLIQQQIITTTTTVVVVNKRTRQALTEA